MRKRSLEVSSPERATGPAAQLLPGMMGKEEDAFHLQAAGGGDVRKELVLAVAQPVFDARGWRAIDAARMQLPVEGARHAVHETDALDASEGGMEEWRADQEGHPPHHSSRPSGGGADHGPKIAIGAGKTKNPRTGVRGSCIPFAQSALGFRYLPLRLLGGFLQGNAGLEAHGAGSLDLDLGAGGGIAALAGGAGSSP